jgi:hypothetical protein
MSGRTPEAISLRDTERARDAISAGELSWGETFARAEGRVTSLETTPPKDPPDFEKRLQGILQETGRQVAEFKQATRGGTATVGMPPGEGIGDAKNRIEGFERAITSFEVSCHAERSLAATAEREAEDAVRAGSDAAAREALERRRRHLRAYEAMKRELDASRAILAEMQKALGNTGAG